MRISEMTPRVVMAEPVEILLRRIKYVPPDHENGILEHWVADLSAEPEVVGLRLDNAAFALMADWFGSASGWNDALLGKPFTIMEPDLDAAGQVKVDENGERILKQRFDERGEPVGGFDSPPNRAKATQECIAIATHRDQRAIGAAMDPDLIEVYYTSLLIAIQIGRGVDPTTAEQTVRKLLPMLGVNLELDVNEMAEMVQTPATTSSLSSPGPDSSSPPEEPSPSTGA